MSGKSFDALFSVAQLKGFRVRNRIVLPPMVCIGYSDESGMVCERNLRHYNERTDGGAGIIIQEATAVRKEGRTAPGQLGIWSDDQIPGLSELSTLVRGHGAISLLQLHHAGTVTPPEISPVNRGPSPDPLKPGSVALTIREIKELVSDFVSSALRAREAGFDGIELHGAHGYLLNQFANPTWNERIDNYGGNFENRMKFASEIITGIRSECGTDFIVGYRLGVNTPTLEDGIKTAIWLESQGVDYLHVSHGGNLKNLPRPPKGFDFNWIVYSGVSVKQHVGIPVIVVNEIKTPERADFLIRSGMADFVAVGRPQLADPHWVRHVQNSMDVNLCLGCKPKCRWYESSSLCPALKRVNEGKS